MITGWVCRRRCEVKCWEGCEHELRSQLASRSIHRSLFQHFFQSAVPLLHICFLLVTDLVRDRRGGAAFRRSASWSRSPIIQMYRWTAILYGHPLARHVWLRKIDIVLFTGWDCLYFHRKLRFFFSVYVDGVKKWHGRTSRCELLFATRRWWNSWWKCQESLFSLSRPLVDFPVPGGGGRPADLQGFHPEQSSTTSPFSQQIVDIPVLSGGLQGFRPGQGSAASSSSHSPSGVHEDANGPGEGFFRTFTQ